MSEMKNLPGEKLFHTMEAQEALEFYKSGDDGLTEAEASARLQTYGPNEIREGKKKTLFARLLEQFKNIMVIILLVAAAISGLMHELADTAIILVVVIINAVLGVMQESKAEKALEALKKMSSPQVKVKRDGRTKRTDTGRIVPGDIVLLEAGDFVPADMRLLQSMSLKIEEAALTGESVPVEKTVAKIDKPDIVIGDRKNMAYSGSSVAYGRGTGIVTATGMSTEVGKIAVHLADNEEQQTPLQKKLSEMSKYLTIGIVGISVIIFLAGTLQGRNYFEMFLTAVSLAVAAIPEGLPAVITIVLALGVQKMAKRNAIVRKLSAVETLGSTEIICSDKTGTLTQNKMTVKEVYLDGGIINAEAPGIDSGSFEVFVNSLVLCNDSKTDRSEGGSLKFAGDPTETALTYYAAQKGVEKDEAEKMAPREEEIPFDSDRKLMTTINRKNGGYRIITKGAPDVLLDRCTGILDGGKARPLTAEDRHSIIKGNSGMAGKALRVLAVAIKETDAMPREVSSEKTETDMVFVGLVGMIDPPRPEVKEAVRVCARAGIRPIMITGDHRDTAAAIAGELGIINSDEEVITGSELNLIGEEEFEKVVAKYSVYARVSPEHKVRIVNSWKKKGRVVAMTGDGVNDAPALKAADIGIGMGITGTDVAKGVSNMVLADDNFATIVIAVEEGRKIYSNIRKTIQFLLSSNLGEVVTLFIATMLNSTILYPIHILWVNLVTDTLPALALGVEKAETDVMKQKPRNSQRSFFAEGMGFSIVYQGLFKGMLTLAAFYTGLSLYSPETAITMAFATLGLIQLTHSLNVRSNDKSLLRLGIFTNRYLIGAIVFSAILQLAVIIFPFLNTAFRVVPLNAPQWGIVFAAAFAIIPIVEAAKALANLRKAA